MDIPEERDSCVLCGANAYEQKYYFNPDFGKLPDAIKEELQIMCVSFTEKCGGVFVVEFDENGELRLQTEAEPSDALYDDIGAELEIKRLQTGRRELFAELSLFYRVVFLGEKADL